MHKKKKKKKKKSKVGYKNYRSISLLAYFEKIIEKLMYKGLSNFLDISNLIYSLKFVFRQNTWILMP